MILSCINNYSSIDNLISRASTVLSPNRDSANTATGCVLLKRLVLQPQFPIQEQQSILLIVCWTFFQYSILLFNFGSSDGESDELVLTVHETDTDWVTFQWRRRR